MDPVAQRDLVERYIAAYNSFDIEGMMRTLHPEIEFENVSNGEVNATAIGADEFRALAERTAELFARRTLTIDAFSTSDEGAVADVTWEVVLASDIPDVGSRGEKLRLRGRSEFEFRDGLIARLIDTS